MMGLVIRHDLFRVSFVRHAMSLVRFDLIANPGAVPSLNEGQIGDFQLAIPPLAEQASIAEFLDRETAKIDALVGEQRRLIELLKEKRQAVISHAVTKGLNPHAPMKPSGIEWLGDVPEYWEVSRVKYHCTIKGRIGFRGYTTADQVDEGNGALVLGATHITARGEIVLEEPTYLSWEKYYESPEIMVSPRDILVVQRGLTSGKVGFVQADHGPATINPSLVLLRNSFKNPAGGSCSRSSPTANSGTPDGSQAVCRSGSSIVALARPKTASAPRPSGSCPTRCREVFAAAPGGPRSVAASAPRGCAASRTAGRRTGHPADGVGRRAAGGSTGRHRATASPGAIRSGWHP